MRWKMLLAHWRLTNPNWLGLRNWWFHPLPPFGVIFCSHFRRGVYMLPLIEARGLLWRVARALILHSPATVFYAASILKIWWKVTVIYTIPDKWKVLCPFPVAFCKLQLHGNHVVFLHIMIRKCEPFSCLVSLSKKLGRMMWRWTSSCRLK